MSKDNTQINYPKFLKLLKNSTAVIEVRDSKDGWCESYLEFINCLYEGIIPLYDVSGVRPKGARLKTFGGRASGPQPLVDLFEFTKDIITAAEGRQLTSAECHKICCKIGQVVVSGGVRRTAFLSLSNLSDIRMRDIKKGDLSQTPELYLSNNSVCYTEKPDLSTFMQEMLSLYESKSGERGVFNRQAAKNVVSRIGRREADHEFGTNPCSEIILRPRQFCNLTEVVVRPEDGMEDLKRKVKLATILGTIQSTQTNFSFIDEEWTKNTEEERLLGVSLTGIMDHPILSGGDEKVRPGMLGHTLQELKKVAIETNKEWAAKLGVNPSTAITCVKPSGTVSQLVDSASGIHDRYAPYYIRRVIGDKHDPMSSVLIDIGVPHEESVTNPDVWVFSFPKKAPESSVYTSSMEKMQLWLQYQEHWCEHKPSVTINYNDDDFLLLAAVIYDSFDDISGISLLPSSDHIYPQAPYEEISEDKYNELTEALADVQDVNLTELLKQYEKSDTTTGNQESACSAGVCDI